MSKKSNPLISRPPWLPPGQISTNKFPIVGERSAGEAMPSLSQWELRVEGLVKQPLCLSLEAVMSRPAHEITRDIHCVTGWSRAQTTMTGFPLAELLDEAVPLPEARFVRFEAYSIRKHDTSLPLELAREDTWLIHHIDGEPLSSEHGYPLRSVTPSRYFYKSLKWLHRIELLADDQLGFWEHSSHYHNDALPWKEQRYTSGSMKARELQRFREAKDFTRYRSRAKVILGADLRAWTPRTRDLRDLQLKNCDLRGACLDGCDLRGANLTRSVLSGASLVGVDLRGADLEGADFAGADLRDADLRESFLSATQFVRNDADGLVHEALIDGLRWDGASGLLETQAAFLAKAQS